MRTISKFYRRRMKYIARAPVTRAKRAAAVRLHVTL